MCTPQSACIHPLLLGEKMNRDIQYPTTLEILDRQIADWTETHRVCVLRMEKLIVEMKDLRMSMNGARIIIRDLRDLKENHIEKLADASCTE